MAIKKEQELNSELYTSKPLGSGSDSSSMNAGMKTSTIQVGDPNKAPSTAATNNTVTNTTATTGNGYQESDVVRAARERLAQMQSPGDYNSTWTDRVQSAIDAINNRTPFSYSANGDALYQQYKDQYTQAGRMAMQDSMGQAAAMTGGYGNSYAASVGQQTYNNYMNQLTDKIPELYQAAYDRYNNETNDLYNRLNLYSQQEQQDYSRYRDSVNDYNTEYDRAYNEYTNERNYDYNQYTDNRDYEANRASEDKKYAYDLAIYMLQSGQTPSAELLAAAGISDADAATISTANKKSSGSGRSSKSTGLSKNAQGLIDGLNKTGGDQKSAQDIIDRSYENGYIDENDWNQLNEEIKKIGKSKDEEDDWLERG